jgi:Protein of unknown function (DUF2867)
VKVEPDEHLQRPFRAHAFAATEGLVLHDVWELDTVLPPSWTLDDLERVLRDGRLPLPVAALFGLRSLAGRLLRIDRGSEGFRPLYNEPAERLYRIENRTVTAFAHLVLIDRRARVAVYVRPHGRAGRAYLLAIEPFRRFVVYPGLLHWAERSVQHAVPE